MSVHTLIDARNQAIASNKTNCHALAKQRAEQLADQNAQRVTVTALALALAKHFIVEADDRAAQAFIAYFVDQSRRMAAQLGVPAIAAAAEAKTSQLAGMLMAKRAETKCDDG